MQNDMSEEEQAQAEVTLAMVQAVQTLNSAVAAAAKLDVYAKLSVYTPPPEAGKPRQTYAISVVRPGEPPAR